MKPGCPPGGSEAGAAKRNRRAARPGDKPDAAERDLVRPLALKIRQVQRKEACCGRSFRDKPDEAGTKPARPPCRGCGRRGGEENRHGLPGGQDRRGEGKAARRPPGAGAWREPALRGGDGHSIIPLIALRRREAGRGRCRCGPGHRPPVRGAGAVGRGEDEMSDQARRQPLPGWTKIYCLALAIGLASGVKDLFTVTQVYLERWQELIRWVVMGDLLFRTVGILLSCLLLWMVYRRDQRFLPLFMVDYVCRFMLAFMSIVVLRVPGINGLLSLLVPSLWLTYFHFSKDVYKRQARGHRAAAAGAGGLSPPRPERPAHRRLQQGHRRAPGGKAAGLRPGRCV